MPVNPETKKRRSSPADRRDWYREWKKGTRVPEIARAAGRDTRTVKKAIEELSREEEIHEVRRDALRTAFDRHQSQLLDAAQKLAETAAEPETTQAGPVSTVFALRKGDAGLGPFRVWREIGGSWRAELRMEKQLAWRLLTEHLKGDELWRRVDAWREAAAELAARQRAAAEAVIESLSQATGLPASRAEHEARVDLHGADLIFQACIRWANGEPDALKNLARRLSVDSDGSFRVGGTLLVHSIDAEAEAMRKALLDTIRELGEREEMMRLKGGMRRYHEGRSGVHETAELVHAAAYIPGECRACARLRP